MPVTAALVAFKAFNVAHHTCIWSLYQAPALPGSSDHADRTPRQHQGNCNTGKSNKHHAVLLTMVVKG